MQLADFEGKIVVLDWFAWWCPFCQAAAPQLLAGIDEWYTARGGNPAGLPVVHVGVNLQPNQEKETQNFVAKAKLQLVLQDFNRAVANRFFGSGQPLFAIINGITNSPSHRPWELIYGRLGYGQTTFPISEFRAAIDAVKAPLVVPPTPPTLVGQPEALTVNPGETAVFSVIAEGTAPLSYQWRKDGGELFGQKDPTLTLSRVISDDTASYDCVVANAGGTLTSRPASLIVRRPPAIGLAPTDLTLYLGQGGAFQVGATGTEPLRYQWRKDGVEITEGIAAQLSFANVTVGDSGSYDVVVSNLAGSVTSGVGRLAVATAPPPFFALSERLPDGRFHLRLQGTPGLQYTIQSSSDLVFWTDVIRERLTEGSLDYYMSAPLDGSRLVYRALGH